jgi:hypothetical protein
MLSIGIRLSGKMTYLNVPEHSTVRYLIKIYKNYHNNIYKKISLKTNILHGIKLNKDTVVKEVLYGKIHSDVIIERDKENGHYILYAEIENPDKNNSKCTVM